MRFLSLFAGIGGFDLGLERAGWECVGQVEIDPFCQKVLAKHWPNVWRHDDVRTVTGQLIRERCGRVDAIVGGFPCQPHSLAGEREAGEDERDLWPEHYRLICEVKPRRVVGENVVGLLSSDSGRFFGGILRDLAAVGYDAEWTVLSASQFGAPHERERLFITAHANEGNGQARMGAVQNWSRQILEMGNQMRSPIWIQAADRFVGVDDGVRGRVYEHRAGSVGNAIVPQIAEVIGRAILQMENL